MHTFVTPRLDYRNALYTGLNQSSLTYLKLVQSPLARLLTGSKEERSYCSSVGSLALSPCASQNLV